MNAKQGLACSLVVCLAVNLIPARAWAGTSAAADVVVPAESVRAVPDVDLKAAVRDAVARLDPVEPSPRPAAATRARAATPAAVVRQGGGGMGAVIGIVSLVAGLGMTYYMIKEMKKDDPTPDGQ